MAAVRTVMASQEPIDVWEYPPPATAATTPVVFLPALGTPIEYYSPLLLAWSQTGRPVFGVQMRTRGDPATRPDVRVGYRALVRQDLPDLFAAGLWEGDPVIVGHSLGGQLALLATALGAISPRAVVTVASGTSSLRHGPRGPRWRRAAQVGVVSAVTRLVGYWPGDSLGFGGRQSRLLMSDWVSEARTGRYVISGDASDCEDALGTITQPLLLVDLVGDALVPSSAVDHLAGRLPAHRRRLSVDTGDPHHFRWARRSPGLVLAAVETWLAERGIR